MTTEKKLEQAEIKKSNIAAKITQNESELKAAKADLANTKRRLSGLQRKKPALGSQIKISSASVNKLSARFNAPTNLTSKGTIRTSPNLKNAKPAQLTIKQKQLLSDIRRLSLEVQRLTTVLVAQKLALQQQNELIIKLQDQKQQIDELHETLGKMPGTSCPATLLPVRLETRFIATETGTNLCVRIFPDDIHIDTHEPELTEAEETFGKHYWQQKWKAADDEARGKTAWAQLAQRFDPERAAWIARATKPLNPQAKPTSSIAQDNPLTVEPEFPKIKRRNASWTRAPRVRALPDRWVISGYRDGERVLLSWGEQVEASLAAGPNPAIEPSSDIKDDELAIDEGMKWLVDFDEAVKVGMALRIPLDSISSQNGFDELYAIGLNNSSTFAAGAKELSELLDAQHFTDGLAFVPQDTPSNNTAEVKSSFTSIDPGSENSYQLNVASPVLSETQESNALVTARALGIEPQTFFWIAHADETEQTNARAMNTALWSATSGYFFEQMLGDAISIEGLQVARNHFINYVRASGTLPVIRAANQPYGILPVTSLEQWVSPKGSSIGPKITNILKELRKRFSTQISKIPHIGRSSSVNTTDEDIQKILNQNASSFDYQGRLIVDSAFFGHNDIPDISKALPSDVARRYQQLRDVLDELGLNWNPRLFEILLTDHVLKFEIPLLRRESGSVVEVDPADYIGWILDENTDFNQIKSGFIAEGGEPDSVFYKLLRHTTMLEYANAAHRVLFNKGLVENEKRNEPSLIDIMHGPSSLLELNKSVTGLGSKPIGEIIHTLRDDKFPELTQLVEFHESLEHLQELKINHLERLLTETLDLSSYRLDAWISSLANYKLDIMRNKKSTGTTLGGYGWIKDLRPNQNSPVAAGTGSVDDTSIPVDEQSGGFVHTPSLNHATTAAILRAGYLAKKSDNNDDPFAVNLSSERVRLADWLLGGVRQGQSMSALLGYRFERGLHENHSGLELDRFIEAFRKIAPMGDIYKARADQEKARNKAKQLRAEAFELRKNADAKKTTADKKVKSLTTKRTTLNRTLAAKQKQADTIKKNQSRRSIFQKFQTNQKMQVLNMETGVIKRQIKAVDGQLSGARKIQATAHSQANLSIIAANNLNQRAAFEDKLIEEAIAREKQLLKKQREKILLGNKKTTEAELNVMESIAASRVVDGMTLQRRYKDALIIEGEFDWNEDTIPFGKYGLPAINTPDYFAVIEELNILDEAVDAVSDAITAESVYQMVQGNSLRTAATLDAMAGGEAPPPELDFVRTPRSGAGLTHRVGVIFSGLQTDTWPGNNMQVRALAEPVLNMWCSEKLGSPERIKFLLEYLEPNNDSSFFSRQGTLAEIGISSLDLVYSINNGTDVAIDELEQRIRYQSLRLKPDDVPSNAILRLNFERQDDWGADLLSVSEIIQVARSLAQLVTNARAMDANDLTPPETAAFSGIDLHDLHSRANNLQSQFDQLLARFRALLESEENVSLEVFRQTIFAFSFFDFTNAIPASAIGESKQEKNRLLKQAKMLINQAETKAKQLKDMAPPAESIEAKRDHALRQFEILLGKSFKTLCHFKTAQIHEIETLFENSLSLQDNNPLSAATWLQRLSKVRPGVARLNNVRTYSDAINPNNVFEFSVGQSPYKKGDLWNVLTFSPGKEFDEDAVSIVVESIPGDNKFGKGVHAGLIVDEWTEIVPRTIETSAIAFNYDAPASCAPQSILLAVPPDNRKTWHFEILESIVRDTLNLSKLRCIDPSLLDDQCSHFFPGLYFALNLDGESISTDFQPTEKLS